MSPPPTANECTITGKETNLFAAIYPASRNQNATNHFSKVRKQKYIGLLLLFWTHEVSLTSIEKIGIIIIKIIEMIFPVFSLHISTNHCKQSCITNVKNNDERNHNVDIPRKVIVSRTPSLNRLKSLLIKDRTRS